MSPVTIAYVTIACVNVACHHHFAESRPRARPVHALDPTPTIARWQRSVVSLVQSSGRAYLGWRQISELTWSPTGGWLVVRTTTPTSRAGNILAIRPPNERAPVPIVFTRASEYTPTLSPAKEVSSPRRSHRGKELLSIDGESNLVAAQVTTTPFLHIERTTVLFNAGDFVGVGASRRDYDVAPNDQRFLMIRRARGLASAQLVIVENWFKEIKTEALG